MKQTICILLSAIAISLGCSAKKQTSTFPDGTPISSWFADTTGVELKDMGKPYIITDYGVINDSTIIQTQKIQEVIDRCHANGGGVIVVPAGTYLTGSLFFKPGCNLYLEENATLKGSDAITHYQIVKTRLEGQTLDYFAALINADHHDGFTIAGKGTLNGNGHKFYDEFWLRRKVIKKCTNLEALRPRLVYISNSNDVKVSGIRMVNSGFWTNHLYKCKRVKYLNLYIYAPTSGYPKGPSTDAIDIDGCEDMLIRGCWVNVNDDGVCLKGGKGTFVDKDSTNAPCRNVIVENCDYAGYCKRGIFIKTNPDRGGFVENVFVKNCTFGDVEDLFYVTSRYAGEGQTNHHFSTVKNIFVDGLKCNNVSAAALVLQGTEAKPVTNVSFDKIEVKNAKTGISFENVLGVNMGECSIGGKVGTPTQDTPKDKVFERNNK